MLLTLAFLSPAQADVRVMNATGRPLTIDLMSEHTTLKGHALQPDKTFSPTLGKALPDNTYETLIVRDADGKELGRQRVVSRGNYAIVNWGQGVSVRAAGNFRGRSASGNRVGMVNTSGMQLGYRLDYPNGDVSEGKTAELRDVHGVTYVATGRHKPPGSPAELTVTTPAGKTVVFSVKTGGLYALTANDETPKVDALYLP